MPGSWRRGREIVRRPRRVRGNAPRVVCSVPIASRVVALQASTFVVLAAIVAMTCTVAMITQPPSPSVAAEPSFPEPEGYVSDIAGVLSDPVRSRLEQLLANIDKRFQVQIGIATLSDIGDEDPTEYANRLYEVWRIGGKRTDRGILLLDVIRGPGRNFFRVEVGYGLEGVLPDGRVGRILDESVMPLLREGDRGRAYAAAVRQLMAPVLREANEDPAEVDSLLAQAGWRRSGQRARDNRALNPIAILIVLIVLMFLFSGGRRLRRRSYWGGPYGGGFGGFGGFGGSSGGHGGGFGGFGGGLSGGGGAGRGY